MSIVTSKRCKLQIGQQFGRLTALGVPFRLPDGKGRATFVVCECNCGTVGVFRLAHLYTQHTNSCGCHLQDVITRHGKVHGPEYAAWMAAKMRCHNPKNPAYFRYGGRGIQMHPLWRESFEAFYAELGPRPHESLSLDRINNDKGYEPGNCRWATIEQQAKNKRPRSAYRL